jgi:hypothetical protein
MNKQNDSWMITSYNVQGEKYCFFVVDESKFYLKGVSARRTVAVKTLLVIHSLQLMKRNNCLAVDQLYFPKCGKFNL